MQQQFRLSIPRAIRLSVVVLILAILLTLLSFTSQGSDQMNVGNLCGVNQNEPCFVSIPKAGWPFPFLVDQFGTSAMGVLGYEDFRSIAFILDFLFFVLVLSGMDAKPHWFNETSVELEINRVWHRDLQPRVEVQLENSRP
jgi:hypothetical protein